MDTSGGDKVALLSFEVALFYRSGCCRNIFPPTFHFMLRAFIDSITLQIVIKVGKDRLILFHAAKWTLFNFNAIII